MGLIHVLCVKTCHTRFVMWLLSKTYQVIHTLTVQQQGIVECTAHNNSYASAKKYKIYIPVRLKLAHTHTHTHSHNYVFINTARALDMFGHALAVKRSYFDLVCYHTALVSSYTDDRLT